MLKIKKGFILREVSGSFIVVAVGAASKEFKGLITLNETGAFLWEKLVNGNTKEGLVEALLNEYDAPREVIENDVNDFLKIITDGGLVE